VADVGSSLHLVFLGKSALIRRLLAILIKKKKSLGPSQFQKRNGKNKARDKTTKKVSAAYITDRTDLSPRDVGWEVIAAARKKKKKLLNIKRPRAKSLSLMEPRIRDQG
jgi:hypothetical protein